MFKQYIDHANAEKDRKSYINLRSKFAALTDIINSCLDIDNGYQGAELADRDTLYFELCFFDKITVIANFSGIRERNTEKLLGRIAFSQDGKICRTFYFNESENIMDEHGAGIKGASLFSKEFISSMIFGVAEKLISDNMAFETVALYQ